MAMFAPFSSEAHVREYYKTANIKTIGSDSVENSAVLDASKAVVKIYGYAEVPAYVIEVEEIPDSEFVKATVRQSGTETRRVSSGSAFFVTSDGYLLTNKHVIGDSTLTYKLNDGDKEMDVEVVYMDPDHDLAVLKVAGSNYPTIKLDSGKIKVGDEVTSIGNALGKFSDSISSGSVVSLGEKVIAEDRFGMEELDGLIVTDAKLYPGDSGGPLLNEDGEAIGVNVAIVQGTNISFSIPAELSKKVLKQAGLSV
jgi:S1-C subfamily serine protease